MAVNGVVALSVHVCTHMQMGLAGGAAVWDLRLPLPNGDPKATIKSPLDKFRALTDSPDIGKQFSA
jgi:hypothetical protein